MCHNNVKQLQVLFFFKKNFCLPNCIVYVIIVTFLSHGEIELPTVILHMIQGEDRTTTPLMPDALVQKTFQQAVASPRKRKRSPQPNKHDHSAPTNCDGESGRPTKCKHVGEKSL